MKTCGCLNVFGWKRVSGFRTCDGTRDVDQFQRGTVTLITESTLEGLPMKASYLDGKWTPWIERAMPVRYWNGYTYQSVPA